MSCCHTCHLTTSTMLFYRTILKDLTKEVSRPCLFHLPINRFNVRTFFTMVPFRTAHCNVFRVPLIHARLRIVHAIIITIPISVIRLRSQVPIKRRVLYCRAIRKRLLPSATLMRPSAIVRQDHPTPVTRGTFKLCPNGTIVQGLPFRALSAPRITSPMLSFVILSVRPSFPNIDRKLCNLILSRGFPNLSPHQQANIPCSNEPQPYYHYPSRDQKQYPLRQYEYMSNVPTKQRISISHTNEDITYQS